MKALTRIGLVVALAGVAACGKSPAQEQAEKLQKAAEEMQKSGGDMQKGAQDMAKGFEAMAKGLGAAMGGINSDQKPVDPVDFKALIGLLPEMSGWERQKPTGERMTMPVSFAQAEAHYNKGDSSVTVKVTDSGFNQLLVAPFAMMLTTGYSKETSEGYEKATTISSYPAFEKWDESKHGELTVFVDKRFIVEVEGSGLSSTKDLQAFLDKTDLKKLADLK